MTRSAPARSSVRYCAGGRSALQRKCCARPAIARSSSAAPRGSRGRRVAAPRCSPAAAGPSSCSSPYSVRSATARELALVAQRAQHEVRGRRLHAGAIRQPPRRYSIDDGPGYRHRGACPRVASDVVLHALQRPRLLGRRVPHRGGQHPRSRRLIDGALAAQKVVHLRGDAARTFLRRSATALLPSGMPSIRNCSEISRTG